LAAAGPGARWSQAGRAAPVRAAEDRRGRPGSRPGGGVFFCGGPAGAGGGRGAGGGGAGGGRGGAGRGGPRRRAPRRGRSGGGAGDALVGGTAAGGAVPGGAVPSSAVLAACSGGADSVALAAALVFEAPRAGVAAGAVTVDHGLQRGSAERADRVAALLRDLG